ncbi:rod shape-determining protein RodA [Metabacillus lacus]
MERQERFDWIMMFSFILLVIFSLVAVYSGSGQYESGDPYYYLKRQLIWFAIGSLLIAAIMFFDYDILEHLAWPMYIAGLLLIILVHLFGVTRNGSQRWLQFGSILIQPSEFMKIFLLVLLAVLVSKHSSGVFKSYSFQQSIPVVLKVGIVSLLPFMFILQQPDLGTALVVLAIMATIIVISGVSFKMIGLLAILGSFLLGLLIFLHQYYFDLFSKVIKPHQLERIYGWLSPHEYASSYGYQLTQALSGIGSGQLTGAGLNQGIQTQSGRIPEVHTDFIFSVIGEEFGFFGSALLLSIYFILIYRMVIIAIESHSLFGTYLVGGVIGLLAFQIFQNVGMTIGLMPITGLALPFISYGGSALLTNMIALGIVMNVKFRTRKYMFEADES